MRELRGANFVTVSYIPTEDNPADLFTKILTRVPFEKHRAFVMNARGQMKKPESKEMSEGTTNDHGTNRGATSERDRNSDR